MAKRHSLLIVSGLLIQFATAGCEQTSRPISSLPAPTFDAPRIAAAQPAPMAPLPQVSSSLPNLSHDPIRSRQGIISRAGVPMNWIPPVEPRAWRWIVVHHSATTTGGAAAFDKMHRAKGWDELGYDFVIGNGTDTRDGQIEVGSRWTKQKIGAHAKTPDNRFNEYGIGICLVGNFDVERPTPAQLNSLTQLTSFLMRQYRITPDNIIGHKDTKSTDCPGRYMYTDLSMIRHRAAQLAEIPEERTEASAVQELMVDTH